ncbi:hypothetical protein VTK73DRAFT_4709 [Phialemonium thermophilum]|uniref:Uncharacterized protein n=1 Tax=Phialemonium thermophilum TaxID=223376 RepID=A0ABR3V7I6_9PEZI
MVDGGGALAAVGRDQLVEQFRAGAVRAGAIFVGLAEEGGAVGERIAIDGSRRGNAAGVWCAGVWCVSDPLLCTTWSQNARRSS